MKRCKGFKYSKPYSGADPELIEGDVFKTIIPLPKINAEVVSNKADNETVNETVNETDAYIFALIKREQEHYSC